MGRTQVSQDEIIETVRRYGSCAFDRFRTSIRQNAIPHKGKTSVVYITRGRLDNDFEYGMVKIYQNEDAKRKQHYARIIPRLKGNDSPHLLPLDYYGNDFLMFGKDGEPFHLPVLAMAWAGVGCTIETFVQKHLHERKALEALLYQFAQLCIWLDKQPFTGSLCSDNIMFQRHAPLAIVGYETLCFKDQHIILLLIIAT